MFIHLFVFREGEGGVGDFYHSLFFIFFLIFLLVNFHEKLYICVMVSVDFSNHERMKQVVTTFNRCFFLGGGGLGGGAFFN